MCLRFDSFSMLSTSLNLKFRFLLSLSLSITGCFQKITYSVHWKSSKMQKGKCPTKRSIFFESKIYGCTFTMVAHSAAHNIRYESCINIHSNNNLFWHQWNKVYDGWNTAAPNAEWCSVLHFSREFGGCVGVVLSVNFYSIRFTQTIRCAWNISALPALCVCGSGQCLHLPSTRIDLIRIDYMNETNMRCDVFVMWWLQTNEFRLKRHVIQHLYRFFVL